jgi:prepilin-type N-terminal cleavage/methylation domain-containing protein
MIANISIMRSYRRNSGFTLIEIVLVLAIAGLIIIAVLLAVSGAQKARRDYQRKQDLAQLVAMVDKWRANHNDANLDTEADLQNLSTNEFGEFKDPSTGTSYQLIFHEQATSHSAITVPNIGQISYMVGHVCGSDSGSTTLVTSVPGAVHGIRQFVVLTALEGGGEVYCLDSK